MAFDNNDRRHPGLLEDADGLQQLDTNVRYTAGVDAGQTDLVIEAPLSFERFIESTHATRFDQVKDLKDNGYVGAATRYNFEYENQAAVGDLGPFTNRLIAAIERIGFTVDRQNLGEIAFLRPESGTWILKLISIFDGSDSATISIRDALTALGENRGFVGINTDAPEYELDVPTGTINADAYLNNGSAVTDWTEAAGTVSHTGPARVTGTLRTTLATGTAPLDATSTTECVGVSADNFEGETWHPGVMASGFDTYAAADTQVAEGFVTRAGEWNITLTAAIGINPADTGLTINVKLKDGSGTQIGDTFPFEVDPAAVGPDFCPAEVVGSYTSAAGNEAIRAFVAVPTGTGEVAEATITMTWQRP